jgi:DNA-damage-inducible protein D
MDRLLIREEVTDGQKSLASTAKRHGIVHYGFFQNKGYMGMYNMSLKNLNRLKGVQKGENLIDRMGRTELAAHLFRITQTDEKIKNDRLVGQQQLEQAAADVGKTVRRTMIELSNTRPEQLPAEENIRNVRKKIKGTSRKFKSLDRRKKRP